MAKNKIKNIPAETESQTSLMDKLERVFKYLPVLTLICYFCGFVIYKSFLLQYGIYEAEILNVRYIEAGLLYLIIAPFIITTQLITNKRLNYLSSIAIANFAFIIFNIIFGNQDLNFLWKACLIVIGLNSSAYFVWDIHKTEMKNKQFDLTELPIFFFMLVIISLTLFSLYFKELKPNLGGGKTYEKILILDDKHDNIIITDSLNHTDTLTIIYESSDFIYFRDNKLTKSIRKELINGEINIK